MKKIRLISLIALMTTLIMSFSFCFTYAGSTDNTESSSGTKPLYLALGDSITYGYAPSDDPDKVMEGEQLTDECFVNILANQKGYTAVNKGINGNTAAGIQKQLDSGELDSYLEKAQIVTITCGGNDLMEVIYTRAANLYNKSKTVVKKYGTIEPGDIIYILGQQSKYDSVMVTTVQMAMLVAFNGVDTSDDFKTALDQFITDLNKVTATIKAKNPDVKIYLATQYNPFEHFSSTGKYAALSTNLGSCASTLHDRVIENAETGQYTVADVYSAFLGNTASYCNATEDPLFIDFHPSVAGHAVIAECFAEVVPEAEIIPEEPETNKKTDTDTDTGIIDSDDGKYADNAKPQAAAKTVSSTEAAGDETSADTGDDTNLLLPSGLMAASAAAIAALLAGRKKSHSR